MNKKTVKKGAGRPRGKNKQPQSPPADLKEVSATGIQDAINKNSIAQGEKGTQPPTPPVPAKPKGMVTVVEEVVHARYEFNEGEKVGLGSGMAQAISQIKALKEEQKSIVAGFKAKIQEQQAFVDLRTEKINSGFEMRPIECNVLHNRKGGTGKIAYKCYYRKDTGAFVKREDMTPSDFSLLNIPWPEGHKDEDNYLPEPAKK